MARFMNFAVPLAVLAGLVFLAGHNKQSESFDSTTTAIAPAEVVSQRKQVYLSAVEYSTPVGPTMWTDGERKITAVEGEFLVKFAWGPYILGPCAMGGIPLWEGGENPLPGKNGKGSILRQCDEDRVHYYFSHFEVIVSDGKGLKSPLPFEEHFTPVAIERDEFILLTVDESG